MKAWTYQEITAKAEEEIIRQLESAKKHADNPGRARHYENMADGVFFFWNDLTMGWRKDNSDENRLRALVGN